MAEINFTIDGKACRGRAGQTVVEAARENGVYIPVLCHLEGLEPAGACRICTVRINGRLAAACTQPLADGMVIENEVPDIRDMRRAILEMLYVEGNHLCPGCEKSGRCELQALAYRYQVLVPRFPFQFPRRDVEAAGPLLLVDHNRCIQCLRCVRAIQGPEGRKAFAPRDRTKRMRIGADPGLVAAMTEETALKAMEVCPVGAILRKEVGFDVPIGRRKYDAAPIGADVEGEVGS